MPINREVKVDLKFNANVKEARTQIESLQNSLTQLAKNTNLQYAFPNGNQMKEVSDAALELQQHLTKAFNVKTGNLDLSKFSASLTKSGKTLKDYRDTLAKIGPEGTKAFSELTSAIAMAERPVISINEKMAGFLTTLKNTAKWQISSSMLHGFVGAIQSAYGYAQDLNESLNNIRIVTGKSTDEMAEFAKDANEAAKALSTTTTAYTDAALIFYQQGLDDEAVTQRTDTVVKMANVTRQSADEVSSYMTAIWNNFYDGSESLEHYADVITALGAATASSSAEIAQGLEKFASIGATVGLSYDYATTALATVVAQTRQSADIVGTAFKTLFARIQDLELGKTLEDGTDLGKYSKALDTIGVKIKDVNGNVREMDDILDDMGAKWKTIDKATQIAVAQTVAGTRQYTQLIALMDNWDKFQNNLSVAQGSEGTLQQQADIFAESWEAAQKRVKASMEDLYDDIINDKFFIAMTNSIAKLVDGISVLVKGLGGVPGILLTISSIFMQNFAYKMPEALENLKNNFKVMTGQAEKDMLSLQTQTSQMFEYEIANKGGQYDSRASEAVALKAMNDARTKLNENAKKLTETERQAYEWQIKLISALGDEVKKRGEAVRLAQEEVEAEKRALENRMKYSSEEDEKKQKELSSNFDKARFDELNQKKFSDLTVAEKKEIDALQTEKDLLDEINQRLQQRNEYYEGFNRKENSSNNFHYLEEFNTSQQGFQIDKNDPSKSLKTLEDLNSKVKDFDKTNIDIVNTIAILEKKAKEGYEGAAEEARKFLEETKKAKNWSKETNDRAANVGGEEGSYENSIAQLRQYAQEADNVAELFNQKLMSFSEFLKQLFPQEAPKIDAFVASLDTFGEKTKELKNGVDALNSSEEAFNRNVEEAGNKVGKTSFKITEGLSAVTTVMGVITSSLRAIDTIMDENTSGTQKFITIVGVLTTVFYAASRVTKMDTLAKLADTAATNGLGVANLFLAKTAEGVSLAFLPVLSVFVALVAVLGSIAFAYKKYQEGLEDTAEEQKIILDKEKEYKESLQETKDNLDGLLNSYDNLIKQWKDGEITQEELKTQSFELCSQYNQEIIAVKALSNNYNDLRNAILEVQKANAQELVSSSERVKKEARISASLNIKSQLKGSERDGNKVDFSGIKDEDLNKLNEIGISTNVFDQANIEDIVNAALDENKREILSEISTRNDTVGRIIQATADQYNIAQEANKSALESIVESRYNKDSITSQSQYDEIVDSLIKELNIENYGGEATEEQLTQLRNNINKSFSVISDEYSKFGQANSLIDLIWGSNKESNKEDIAKAIEGITDKNVLSAIASDFNLFNFILKDSKDAQKAIDEYSNKFGKSIQLQTSLGLKNALKEGLVSDKSLTKKDINDLYEKGFNPLDIEKSDFELMDDVNKRNLMLQETIKNNEIIRQQSEEEVKILENELHHYENIEQVERSLQEEAFGTVGQFKAAEQAYDNLLNKIAESTSYEDYSKEQIDAILSYTEEELKKAFEDGFFGDAFEGDFEELKELKAAMEESFDSSGIAKYGSQLRDYNKKLEDSKNYVKDLNNRIKELKSNSWDYEEILKETTNLFNAYNKKIDEIQSSYKTLVSASQEFTANGYLTADTYQSLLNLSPQYLSCLVNEKGQLDINKETIKEVTLATYDNIAAMKLQEIEVDVLAIEQNKQTLATLSNKYVLDLYTDSLDSNAEALKARISALTATSEAERQVRENMLRTVDAIMLSNQAAKKGVNTDLDAALGAGKTKSQKDKKDLKKYDDEFDRYHDIKEVLEELADAISDVEKQQKHLYGKELAKSLREENVLLEQQEAAYRELGAQQKQEQSELVASLGSMGVAFDQTSGQITNYAQATAAALQTLNEAITTYNASAQTEADKKILEAAQKNYDEFKKKLERYDALIEEIRDTENKLDDLFYKKLENNLKAWEAEIKFTLDIRDAEKAWKKFVNTMNEDFKSVFKDVKNQLKGLAEQANDLIKKSGSIDVRLGAMQDIQNEIDKLMAGEESSMFASVSEAQEKLKEYIKDLQSDAEELYNLYRQAWDAYLDGIDQAIGRFDDLNNQYERLDDNLNHQARVIELLYGEQAYDFLSELYDAESKSLLGQLDSLNKQIEFYKSQYEDAVEKWGADSAAAQKWKEAWEGAIDELHAKEEAYIEAIQNKARNAIDKIFYDLERKMTNGLGLQKMQEHWQDALAAAEDYYDEVEKIYQIDRIENLYKQAIDSTSSIKAQQRLSSIMDDQVNSLEKKTNLSKYDIELAEKRLQVYQAQIALEDAQNNKTSMKLTRGEDGNWSYQYVADEEDVANKQQALLDRQNELYEFTKTRWQDLQGEIIELTSTAFTRIHELENESLGATTERQAEIAEELVYLRDYYFGEEGLITMKVRQSNEIQRNVNEETANLLWTLYDTDYENYARMNEKEQALLDQLITNGVNGYENLYDTVFHSYESISDLIEEINADSINTWTEAAAEIIRLWNSDDGDSVLKNIEEAITKCTDILNEYFEDIQKGTEAAGEDFTDVSSKIKDVTDKVQELDGTTEEMIENTKSELSEYEAYLKQCEEAWNRMKNTLVNAMETAISYLSKVGDGIKRQVENMRSLTAAANEAYAAAQRAISAGGSVGGSGEQEVFWGHGDQELVKRYEAEKREGESLGEFMRRKKAASHDTGGYTGSWHGEGLPEFNDGKLAILHQKELVLNESDTSNILKVVDMVRNMGQSILNGLHRRFSGFDTSNIVNNNNKETSNTFNITAEFPNANNVDDIREAILSLPNIASQYVYEK